MRINSNRLFLEKIYQMGGLELLIVTAYKIYLNSIIIMRYCNEKKNQDK